MTSLPVPVSPVIKMVAFVGATASTSERMERRPPRRPTIVSRNDGSERSRLRTIDSSGGKKVVLIVVFSRYPPTCVRGSEIEAMFHSYISATNELLRELRCADHDCFSACCLYIELEGREIPLPIRDLSRP